MRELSRCGFGHRVLLMDIEKPLRGILERLVAERGVTIFYTGGMGEFDELFARTVRSMPKIRFHELRHSAASNLLNMNFSLKDVQEWLGHSDIKTTANIYGHLDAKRKKPIAEALSM